MRDNNCRYWCTRYYSSELQCFLDKNKNKGYTQKNKLVMVE